jgi:hypothetical protein
MSESVTAAWETPASLNKDDAALSTADFPTPVGPVNRRTGTGTGSNALC